MAASEEDQVTQAVMEYLATADMTTTTERMVVAHIQNTLQLSRPATVYKKLVSETIEAFLASLEEDEASDEEPVEEDDHEAKPAKVRKRGASTKGEGSSKKPRVTGGDADDDSIYNVDLGGRKKARVRRYKGKLYVDVREFYTTPDGAEGPSPKGLSMDALQWARLVRDLPRLVGALRQGDEATATTKLSEQRMASVSSFKGVYYLNLREYYSKDGELLPTKKGVSLNQAAAEALLVAAPAITDVMGGPVDAPPVPETAAPEAPVAGHKPAAAAAAAAAAAGPSGSGGGGAAAGAGVQGGGRGAAGDNAPREVVELGGSKRLRLDRYKGLMSVDLREFYQKDGEMLPGKKGISLSPEDWSKVSAHLGDISAALQAKQLAYVLPLSGMRRVCLSEFRGTVYVSIREYYDKGGGQLAPGSKGLNMGPREWGALVAGAPGLNAALRAAQQAALEE